MNTTTPLSLQLLTALVAQLRNGSRSLLVQTVAVSFEQEFTEKDESIKNMVARCLDALFAEVLSTDNIKAKPAKAFAAVSGSVNVTASNCYMITASNHYMTRPAWWPQDDKSSYASSMSDTSGFSHEDLEDIVMNLRNQSIHNDQVQVLKGSGYYQSIEAD